MLEGLALLFDRRRWRVYYLAIGATLLFGVALPKALSSWDGLEDQFGTAVGGDFLAFYTGGRMVLEGRSHELYDLDAQEALQDALLDRTGANSSPFVNPPPYALVMAPFGALPYLGAVFLWWALALVLLAASLRAVGRALDPTRLRLGSGLLFSLFFLPTMLALIMGQNTFVSLALTTAAFLALRRERDVLAGLALGAMVLKPQLALGFALVLLVQRRWRAVGVATAVALGACALSHLLLPGAWEGYLAVLPETAALVRNQLPGYQFPAFYQVSVAPALMLLFDGISPRIGDVLGPVAAGMIAIAVARRWRGRPWEPGSPRWDLAMAASIAAGWLASPHFLFYDLALFLLPAWVAYVHLGAGPEGRPFGGSRFYGLTLLTLLLGSLWVPLVSAWLWTIQGDADLPRIIPQGVTLALVFWVVALGRLANESDSREKTGRHVRDLTANEDPPRPVPGRMKGAPGEP